MKSSFSTGLLAGAVAGLVLALTACATTDGIAVRGPGTTVTSGTTPPTKTTALTSTGPTDRGPTSTGPTSTGPDGPPSCGGTINRLTTPTGAPIITVTPGANFFVANFAVEPLSIAVYADGTTITSTGVGTATEPLPAMKIGYLPPCTVEWAKKEIQQLATVDLSGPNVTDQGATDVSYRPTTGADVHLSAYALGITDEKATTGQPGRARLTVLLSTLRAPLAGAAAWTPDRLKIVKVPAPVASAGDALVWPGPTRLEQVLTEQQGRQRCGVVSGATAAAVLAELGDRNVHSRWTDAAITTGLNIGALVPGQEGCRQS